MKDILSLCLLAFLFLFSINLNAQLQEVDVFPYAVSCDSESSVRAAIRCSEGKLKSYFLSGEKDESCPANGMNHLVQITLNIDEEGIYTAKARSKDMDAACMKIIKDKCLKLPYDIELFPAEINKKTVPYVHTLSFFYPEDMDPAVVDLIPFAVDCDSEPTLSAAIKCSEDNLKGYFLNNLNEETCPIDSINKLAEITLKVDAEGSYTAVARAEDMSPVCMKVLEARCLKMPSDIELFPAEFEKKAVPYVHTLSFHYPENKDPNMVKFEMVEVMPRFKSETCESQNIDLKAKQKCATEQMLMNLYKTLRYPADAREKGIEGMVVVQFVIEKTGYISNPTIKKSVGAGCDEEALRIIQEFNNLPHPPFIPGMTDDKPVRVKFSLPIRYKLGGRKSSRRKKKRRR